MVQAYFGSVGLVVGALQSDLPLVCCVTLSHAAHPLEHGSNGGDGEGEGCRAQRRMRGRVGIRKWWVHSDNGDDGAVAAAAGRVTLGAAQRRMLCRAGVRECLRMWVWVGTKVWICSCVEMRVWSREWDGWLEGEPEWGRDGPFCFAFCTDRAALRKPEAALTVHTRTL